MKSRLKKSLYLGLAALSLGAMATATTTADAASKKATIVSKSALGKASKNVEVTGTNAIYTKPGVVKGAKRVASKAQVKKLATSKSSNDYFRAYHMALTSRGTVYYKVVSMNGKYRGYIYGGKVQGTLAGGIREAQTTKTALTPSRVKGFHLRDVKKNTLWTAPKNTEYKSHKVSLYGLTKKDTFTVSKAETKTKEGTLYYYVTADKDSSIAGWVYAGTGYKDATTKDFGGLSISETEDVATNDNSVRVIYRDASKKQVGEGTWITTAEKTHAGDLVNASVAAPAPAPAPVQPGTSAKPGTDKSSIEAKVPAAQSRAAKADSKEVTNLAGQSLKAFIEKQIPSGYQLASTTDAATLANKATYGNTVYVDVIAAATSKVQLVMDKITNADTIKVTGALTPGAVLSTKDFTPVLSADGVKALTGSANTQIGETNLKTLAGYFGATPIKGSKTYHTADGKSYVYYYTFNKDNFVTDNRLANYGGQLKATYTATLTEGTADVSTPNVDWMAK